MTDIKLTHRKPDNVQRPALSSVSIDVLHQPTPVCANFDLALAALNARLASVYKSADTCFILPHSRLHIRRTALDSETGLAHPDTGLAPLPGFDVFCVSPTGVTTCVDYKSWTEPTSDKVLLATRAKLDTYFTDSFFTNRQIHVLLHREGCIHPMLHSKLTSCPVWKVCVVRVDETFTVQSPVKGTYFTRLC